MEKTKKNQKKTTARRLAPIGLWVGLVGLLAVISLLAVKVFIYMQLYAPPNADKINIALWICIGIMVIGPAFYTLLNPQGVREFLTGRQARYGSNAVIMLTAFLGILLVVNIITFQNPKQWDLTEDQQHTLATETLNTLKALPSPVKAIAFYTSRISSSTASDLLSDFKTNGDGKFDFEFVDPEQNPTLAQKYSVTRDGTIVVTMDDRYEVVSYASEQELTGALVRLINPGERAVYFLTGHGENDINGSDDRAYTKALAALQAKQYTVSTLNLAAENKIPEDALAIIIAGPQQPVSANEATLLENYLENGGSLVILEEPVLLTQSGGKSDPLLDYLSTNWGITFNDDFVIDPNANPAIVAVANAYGTHAITEKLMNILTFYPSARSLTTSPVSGLTQTNLVSTMDSAWGETDFTSLQGSPSFDRGADFPGPVELAAAVENTTSTARVVAIGDSDFASDSYYTQYANGDLLINAIDWAAEQDSQIGLTAKTPVERQLNPISQVQLLMLALSLICLLPGLVIAGGVAAWLMHRKRG